MKTMTRSMALLAVLIASALVGVHCIWWFAAQRSHRSIVRNKISSRQPQTSDTLSGDKTVPVAGKEDPVGHNPSRKASPVAEQNEPAIAAMSTLTSDVPLPSPVADRDVTRMLAILERNQIYEAQDKVMETWPKYSEVREGLPKGLSADQETEELSTEQLVDTALQLRDVFWETGGCLSTSAVLHAYNARRLLEQAHDREPDNMAITDALAETIQATWVCGKYDPGSKQWVDKVAHDETAAELMKLRSAQYSQIRREEAEGRNLAWEDFCRVNDVAWLAHRRGDPAQAREALEWLIEKADKGGWQAYVPPLRKWLGLMGKDTYNYNIYTSMSEPREKYEYSRRLPSFKGPRPEERGVKPVHEYVPVPVWSSGQSRHTP